MDKLKTGSGKKLRTEALTPTAVPVPYDAAAMPGALVLGTDGLIYASSIFPGDTTYQWVRLTNQSQSSSFYVGAGSPSTDVTGNQSPPFQVELAGEVGSGNLAAGLGIIAHVNAPTAAGISICKTRGAVPGSRVLVQQGDRLLSLNAQGADGVKFVVAAAIRAWVDGPTALNQIPCRLDFGVAPLAAGTPNEFGNTAFAVDRMRLNTAGNLLIGNTTGTERLSVTGNIQLTNTADSYKVGTDNVVGSRKTGWAAPTGTANRTTFDTATATTADLAERLKALIDDLTSHGLIGPTP